MDFRKSAILWKLEGSYGVDAAPTGAADAVLISRPDVQELDHNMIEREAELGSHYGHREEIPVGAGVTLAFGCEMVGSGALGTAPQWGKILKCLGFSETINPGVSVVYTPVSTGISSASAYWHKDTSLAKALGTRGTKLSLKVSPKGIPYFEIGARGLYGGVTDAAFPSQTLTAWKAPIAVNNANTGAFALHGFAGKCYDMQIDVNPETVHRDLIGVEDVVITNRKPAGRIVIEEPTVATKDFWTIVKNGTVGALTITHGIVAGYKVKIDAPSVQLKNPRRENRDGVVAIGFDLRFVPTAAGNDELTITAI
jgi:hypothetical protein